MSLLWREAATVILASLKTVKSKSVFNYDLLSIKRSAKNSFMPGMYVFPGGVTHDADSSNIWVEWFSRFNLTLNTKLDGTVPPILKSNDNVSKLISLKITAIRETFEETGILLCTQEEESSKWASVFSDPNLISWRSKVEKNASEFYNLCENFNCYPDINSLHLWSNWLTPKNRQKRFDTIFFVAAVNGKPSSAADKNEIDEVTWYPPDVLLHQNEEGHIVLAPPQLYEISRLLNFTDCNDLVNFANKRACQGCERWMSYYLKANDGTILLLPGDDSYKVDSFEGLDVPPDIIDTSMAEFRSKSETLHRIEGKKIVIKNYNPKNGHVLPIS